MRQFYFLTSLLLLLCTSAPLAAQYSIPFDSIRTLIPFSDASANPPQISYFLYFSPRQDSSFRRELRGHTAKFTADYKSEKKKQSHSSLHQGYQIHKMEYKPRHVSLWILFLLVLISGMISYLFVRRWVSQERESRLEAERRLMQLQMNPHFIFNSLAAIQSLLYENTEADLAISYLTRFSRLMRRILENSRETYISLEEEVETMRLYLDVQKLRFEEALTYEIQIAESLDPAKLQIPPMFAQPFLENAIEHGLRGQENGHIRISFDSHDGQLELIVEDNGIGREQSIQLQAVEGHRSLAMEIVRDRLRLLSKKVKQQFDFHITDLKDEHKKAIGTKVRLSLPLIHF